MEGGIVVAPRVSLIRASKEELDTVRMINSTLKSSTHTGFLDENDIQDVFKWGAIFLIKVGGETVGTASFRPDRENSGTALLRNLEILQEYQGRGIGTETMQLLLSAVKELGFKKARSRVRPEKDMSLRIHKRLGFEEVGNDDSFGDGILRLVMEKRLR